MTEELLILILEGKLLIGRRRHLIRPILWSGTPLVLHVGLVGSSAEVGVRGGGSLPGRGEPVPGRVSRVALLVLPLTRGLKVGWKEWNFYLLII